jgi:hypothetical protein
MRDFCLTDQAPLLDLKLQYSTRYQSVCLRECWRLLVYFLPINVVVLAYFRKHNN